MSTTGSERPPGPAPRPDRATRPERDPRVLALSLVSHTNVGKTTLARTLLRKDVGEVLDQAHVTDENESYTLIETRGGERLELWDTPGFGDSARLLRRLEKEDTRLGWFLSQVWDRFSNRPLWCNQQALRNARDVADVVLYLVSASEDPDDAGYVDLEMRILAWIGRPVIVLLNQTGGGRSLELARADLARWRTWFETRHEIVADVLDLDAFSRCWVQEGLLFEAVGKHLPPERRALLERLLAEWTERNRDAFDSSIQAIADHVAETACDTQPLVERGALIDHSGRKQATRKLGERLEARARRFSDLLLELHGLGGHVAVETRARMEDFALPRKRLEPWKAGAMGGVLSGALGGLAADVMAGGLTLGGGFITGALLGAFGSLGFARALEVVRGERDATARWSVEFLDALAKDAILRYLAVAHFGRGHGEFREDLEPKQWREAVEEEWRVRSGAFERAWKHAAGGSRASGGNPAEADEQRLAAVRAELRPVLRALAKDVLARFYPETEHFL